MKSKYIKGAFALVLLMGILALPTSGFAAGIPDVVSKLISWAEKNGMYDNPGTDINDWYAIGSAQIGKFAKKTEYLGGLEAYVQQKYQEPNKLDASKATEWHRIAMAVMACGGNPQTMSVNLIADGTYDRGKTASLGKQGINGWIWALITLDSGKFAVPDGAVSTREDMISQILSRQLENGGFSLTGGADPDITGMVITALAPYYRSKPEVMLAVDRALTCLSAMQLASGGFSSSGTENAESAAQVVTALCTMGINPHTEARFIKNGSSVLDALLAYQNEDGGFRHTLDGTKSDAMAGGQALCALAAYSRFEKGQGAVYSFEQPKGVVKSSIAKQQPSVPEQPAATPEAGESTSPVPEAPTGSMPPVPAGVPAALPPPLASGDEVREAVAEELKIKNALRFENRKIGFPVQGEKKNAVDGWSLAVVFLMAAAGAGLLLWRARR